MQNKINKTGMVAVHNLSIENMEKVLDRNVFICPSIAYTTDENCIANSNFGPITVVFSEDVINPEKNPNAVLLSGNGFSGTVGGSGYDGMSNEELVEEFIESYNDDEEFMYRIGYDICKAYAVTPISIDQALQECNRIISEKEYTQYEDKIIEEYENFLNKNFNGWEDFNKNKQYVFETPFTRENSIRPDVEIGLKEAIKACSKHLTLPAKRKAIKEACQKYGLKITPIKINKIIDFTQKLRESSICYFEAKLFHAVPLTNIKGIVLPEFVLKYNKEIENKLKDINIPYSFYTNPEERKNQILLYAHDNKERDLVNIPVEKELSSLEDKLTVAEEKAVLHNKGIENKTKDDLSL